MIGTIDSMTVERNVNKLYKLYINYKLDFFAMKPLIANC